MTTPVFHAEPALLAGVRPGGVVSFGGDEARHAATVRRLRPGEEIDLVDGEGVRVTGHVTTADRDTLTLSVADVVREQQPEPRLVLVQALAKGGRDEQAIEAATELGVDAVVPWQAARSVAVWRGEKVTKGRRRWEAVTRAAAKQSRRAWFPPVRDLLAGGDLVDLVAATLSGGGAVLVLDESATGPLTAADLPEGGEIAVVVGPEGGITDEEVAALAAAGAQVLLAGPHVMRSSTAGPAALAVLTARLGRWG